METTLHIQTAKRFVEASVNLYDEGFYLAAGEMIWGATIQAVCALAHIESNDASDDHPSAKSGNIRRFDIISNAAHKLQSLSADTSSAVTVVIAKEKIVGILHNRFNSGEEPGPDFKGAWELGLQFSEGLIEAAEQGLLGKF